MSHIAALDPARFGVAQCGLGPAHPVAEMRHVSILEPSGEVEFVVLAAQVVEQPSTVPEEDRNQVDLHLVHLPGSEKCPGRTKVFNADEFAKRVSVAFAGAESPAIGSRSGRPPLPGGRVTAGA